MTIAILQQVPGKRIVRPFTRAVSADEALELLSRHIDRKSWKPENLDTDEPVATGHGFAYYLFTE